MFYIKKYKKVCEMKKMKYIAFFDTKPENLKAAVKKQAELPEFGVKSISESYTILGKTKGFQILEVEDEKELEKMVLYYFPELEFEILPIIEVAEVIKLMS